MRTVSTESPSVPCVEEVLYAMYIKTFLGTWAEFCLMSLVPSLILCYRNACTTVCCQGYSLGFVSHISLVVASFLSYEHPPSV